MDRMDIMQQAKMENVAILLFYYLLEHSKKKYNLNEQTNIGWVEKKMSIVYYFIRNGQVKWVLIKTKKEWKEAQGE